MRQIHSLCELPQKERQTIRSIAIRNGLFASLIGTTILYLLDFYPFTIGTGFSFAVSFLLSFNPPILLFILGYVLSESIQLAKIGYVRSTQPYELSLTPQPRSPFNPSQTSPIYSSTSINPASGLPMCGSSGVDCRGNPLGTNSW